MAYRSGRAPHRPAVRRRGVLYWTWPAVPELSGSAAAAIRNGRLEISGDLFGVKRGTAHFRSCNGFTRAQDVIAGSQRRTSISPDCRDVSSRRLTLELIGLLAVAAFIVGPVAFFAMRSRVTHLESEI